MRLGKTIVFFVFVVVAASECKRAGLDWRGTIEVVDGVTTISNPDIPIRGVVLLELEKALEINPFEFPDVGMEYIYSTKDQDGEVILYDSNRSEAHRFSSKGEYIGSLVRIGEGPGEFQQFRGFKVRFRENQIWAFSSGKLAKFSKEGEFIEEKKIGRDPAFLIDDSRYVCLEITPSVDGQARRVVLLDTTTEDSIIFFEATKEWMIRKGTRAFSNDWATPSIKYAYSPYTEKVYAALNEEYKIFVYNIAGILAQIIKRPHERENATSDDIEVIMGRTVERESMKWIFDAFPNKLAALKDIKILPNGFVGVYRIVGPKIVEIDVYDPDGKLTYALELPQGISVENAQFYEFGFATTITRDEYPIYVEYKVKNVPDIFTK